MKTSLVVFAFLPLLSWAYEPFSPSVEENPRERAMTAAAAASLNLWSRDESLAHGDLSAPRTFRNSKFVISSLVGTVGGGAAIYYVYWKICQKALGSVAGPAVALSSGSATSLGLSVLTEHLLRRDRDERFWSLEEMERSGRRLMNFYRGAFGWTAARTHEAQQALTEEFNHQMRERPEQPFDPIDRLEERRMIERHQKDAFEELKEDLREKSSDLRQDDEEAYHQQRHALKELIERSHPPQVSASDLEEKRQVLKDLDYEFTQKN